MEGTDPPQPHSTRAGQSSRRGVSSFLNPITNQTINSGVHSLDQADEVFRRYEARFRNFEEISIPAIFQDPRFIALVESAITRGRPLSWQEVSAAIPDAPWDL